MGIIKNQKEMNIIGQGGKIILFMLPFLVGAIWAHLRFPEITSFPEGWGFLKYPGYILLIMGVGLWATGVTQLLIEFPKGKLITTCAYGIVRNPIYSSVTFYVLPAVALITQKWVYLIPALALFVGVNLFIGKEEAKLANVFGKEYEEYTKRVNRIVPFKKKK